jgi:hypothetical protein
MTFRLVDGTRYPVTRRNRWMCRLPTGREEGKSQKNRTSHEVRTSHPFPIQGPEKAARSPRPPRVDQVGGVHNNWYFFGPSFPAGWGREKAISYIREVLLTIATYATLAIAF